MLQYAIIFFVISVIAGIFGFRGVAGTSQTIAKFLFGVFLILFVLTLIFGSAII
ncbi:MAG: DUF1328 domain-containing protein [Halanaerobium sp.]